MPFPYFGNLLICIDVWKANSAFFLRLSEDVVDVFTSNDKAFKHIC